MLSRVSQRAELPSERLGAGVADVLTLTLPRADGILAADELTAARRWLRAAATYLLQFCPEEDHIPYNLLKLAQQDKEVLDILAGENLPPEQARELSNVPACMAKMPEAIWLLTEPKMEKLGTMYVQ